MTDLAEAATADPTPTRDPITRWLLLVAGLVAVMVVVGGFVRLSRAGLSVVEWDVVTGVVPPIGDTAWDEAFAEYQLTPEYRLVNEGMTLAEFKRIYLYEWGHRLVARITGLAVVVPLAWFLWRRRMSVRESLPYWGIAALFGLQGALGWVMVSSGLQDRPRVSEARLTIHLLAAALLLGLVLWMALNRIRDARPGDHPDRTDIRRQGVVLLCAVVIQLALGGLVAGMRAGHLSNTWPLMGGRLVPDGVFEGDALGLLEPLGAHWAHRWFAVVVLSLAVVLTVRLNRRRDDSLHRLLAVWLGATVSVQVALGVWTVLSNVSKWVALGHQAVGVALFTVVLVVVHTTTGGRSDRHGNASVDLTQS